MSPSEEKNTEGHMYSFRIPGFKAALVTKQTKQRRVPHNLLYVYYGLGEGKVEKRQRKKGKRRRKRGKEKEEEEPKKSSRNFRAQFSLVGIFHRSCPACCGESEIKLSYSIADKTFEKFCGNLATKSEFASELHFARH